MRDENTSSFMQSPHGHANWLGSHHHMVRSLLMCLVFLNSFPARKLKHILFTVVLPRIGTIRRIFISCWVILSFSHMCMRYNIKQEYVNIMPQMGLRQHQLRWHGKYSTSFQYWVTVVREGTKFLTVSIKRNLRQRIFLYPHGSSTKPTRVGTRAPSVPAWQFKWLKHMETRLCKTCWLF